MSLLNELNTNWLMVITSVTWLKATLESVITVKFNVYTVKFYYTELRITIRVVTLPIWHFTLSRHRLISSERKKIFSFLNKCIPQYCRSLYILHVLFFEALYIPTNACRVHQTLLIYFQFKGSNLNKLVTL